MEWCHRFFDGCVCAATRWRQSIGAWISDFSGHARSSARNPSWIYCTRLPKAQSCPRLIRVYSSPLPSFQPRTRSTSTCMKTQPSNISRAFFACEVRGAMPHKRSTTGFHIRSAIRKPKDYQKKSKRTPPPFWLRSQAAKVGVPSDFEDEVMKKARGPLVPFGQKTAKRTVWSHRRRSVCFEVLRASTQSFGNRVPSQGGWCQSDPVCSSWGASPQTVQIILL